MTLEWIEQHWQTIILVISGIWTALITLNEKFRSIVLAPFTKAKEKSELTKDIKVSDSDGDTALLELISKMKLNLEELNSKLIDQSRIVSHLNQKIDTYATALNKITLMCDVMCSKSEFCKEQINSVLKDLKLINDSDN